MKKTSPKPLVFGKPEKTSWLKVLLLVLFAVSAISAFVWMYLNNTSEPPLVCDDRHGASSLTAMGTCHEQSP